MSQYKVPQDVEAEDKILGYLTFKQLIYVIIGLMYGFLMFSIFRKVPILFVIIGLPPTALFLMLGLIQRQGQPFEAYFLALINYVAKPTKRLWQKDQTSQFFKITHPQLVDVRARRNPAEVKSQLEQLAHAVDTRGFETKSAAFQEPNVDEVPAVDLKDRLVAPTANSVVADEAAPMDILDAANPVTQNLTFLIKKQDESRRETAIAKMRSGATAQVSSSGLPEVPSPDILKLATSDLKVSQVAGRANRMKEA